LLQIPYDLPVVLKQAVHDILGERNELPEERALSCDNNFCLLILHY